MIVRSEIWIFAVGDSKNFVELECCTDVSDLELLGLEIAECDLFDVR